MKQIRVTTTVRPTRAELVAFLGRRIMAGTARLRGYPPEEIAEARQWIKDQKSARVAGAASV